MSTLDVTDGGQYMSFFGVRQGPGNVQVEDVQQPVQFDLSLVPVRELALSLASLTIRDVHVSGERSPVCRLCRTRVRAHHLSPTM